MLYMYIHGYVYLCERSQCNIYMYSHRNDREAFIRAKYVLNAFVHPHPDFERPEIPLAPQQPSLQELLSSTRERQAELSPRVSPRSSPSTSKRMLSPAIRLRATKPKSYRPLSQSVSGGIERGDSFDLDDDLLREFAASNLPNSSGATSSMALLAENFKKLEKSGKLKNWNIAKIKAPRKSSFTQLSGKFSKSYQALNRRFRSDSTKSTKSTVERDAHSDNEDSDNSSATPLLHSKSASSLTPPPKPPRTFKQRALDLTGDGDVSSVLLFNSEGDDFSGDVLSAIREMGVVAVLESEDRGDEDRFSKSLPNGGLKFSLSGDLSRSSPGGRVSSTLPLHSPRNMSPLASEPPARAALPPPALSPVHEGESCASESKESISRDDLAESALSPASTVDSCQMSVFDEICEKPTFEPLDPILDDDSELQHAEGDKDFTDAADTNTLVLGDTSGKETGRSVSPVVSDGTFHATAYVSSENPFENAEDGFTEFQSAEPTATLRSYSPPPQEVNTPTRNKDTSPVEVKEVPHDKRMSVLSITSADYYSFDEDEPDEDNVSNYSTEFPELQCSVVNYSAVCPNLPEDELNLFSTPPTSPPLTTMTLGRMQKKRMDSSSERSTSNSPRPKSASPLDNPRRYLEGVGVGSVDILRRSCSPRPKSASTCTRSQSSRESQYEEPEVVGDRGRTLHQNQPREVEAKEILKEGGKEEPCVSGQDVPPEPVLANTLTDSAAAIPSEAVLMEEREIQPEERGVRLEGQEVQTEEQENRTEEGRTDGVLDETFEDAADTGLDDSSDLRTVSTVSMDATYTTREVTTLPRKSHSANTSPNTADQRKNTPSPTMTRSATDMALKSRVQLRYGLHSRSRSSTVHESSNIVPPGQRHSLQEVPDRPKDLAKLIRKSGDEKAPSDQVTSFSDQDFADIFRSSFRSSSKEVPLVRVESADGNRVTEEAGGEEGDGREGGQGEGGGDVRTLSPNHLQAPDVTDGSQAAALDSVIIPDNISPDLVSLRHKTLNGAHPHERKYQRVGRLSM